MQLREKMVDFKNAPFLKLKYEHDLNKLNAFFMSDSSKITNEQLLLNFLSNFSSHDKITLIDFPRSIYQDKAGMRIQTNSFSAEGNFENLLSLVFELERKQKFCKVSSVKMIAKKNINSKTSKLTATLYLRTINQSDNDVIN